MLRELQVACPVLDVDEDGVEGVGERLPTAGWLQRRTTARNGDPRSPEQGVKGVQELARVTQLLGEEGEGGWLTGGDGF